MATEANIVVTLDIGGSGAKAVAYDAVRQRCVASAAVPYPAGGDGGDPGLFEPEDWWHAAVGALTELRLALTEPSLALPGYHGLRDPDPLRAHRPRRHARHARPAQPRPAGRAPGG